MSSKSPAGAPCRAWSERLEPRVLLASWFVDNGTGGTGTVGVDGPSYGTSVAAPFRTINYAAQLAQPGDAILVRRGTYREEVRPLNNGSAVAPITYAPYNNETVTVRGTRQVDGSWTRVAGTNTYYTPWVGQYVSAVNNSDQVFVDDVPVNLARWPDQGNSDLSRPNQAIVDAIVSSTPTGQRAWTGGYEINRVVFRDASFTDTSGLWVGAKIWMNNGGAQNPGVDETQDGNGVTGTVVATDGVANTITVDIGASAASGTDQPGNFKLGRGSRYYLFDPTSLPSNGLPHAGGWWRDRRGTTDVADDRLYLRTFDNADPATSVVETKQRDWAFNFDTGTGTTDRGRSYITVKDFNVFGASITTDRLAGNGSQGPDGGNLRGNTTANASNIILDGLNLSYVSHFTNQAGDLQAQWAQSSGVILSGRDNAFINGRISWSAGSGIIVLGQRNRVLNSTVHDTNYLVTEGGAIGMGSNRKGAGPSVDTEVAYNEVYNTGIDGIQFDGLRNSTGNKNDIRARIHHNVVRDTVLQSADSGGIKMVGADGNWVRIDHNVVYNTGGPQTAAKYLFYGIYLDYTATTAGGYVVDHNVVYASPIGININKSYNTEVYNNTLLQPSTTGRHSIGNDAGGTMDGVVIRNNLANRPGRGLSGTGVNAVLSNNAFTAAESGTWFANALAANLASRDYALVSNATTTAGAGAIERGVSVGPFDDAVIGLPDLGAYEYGAPRWSAGVGQVSVPSYWVLSGTVYRDADLDGTRDAGEPGISGRAVYLDANGNGAYDAATNRSFAYTGPSVAIPDYNGTANGVATATISVPANSGTITGLRVTLGIDHTFDGDLYGFLIAPDGTSIPLMAGNGSGGDNFTGTTFDDAAGTAIGSGAAPFTGTFRPAGSLASLDGKAAAGTWTLRVEDRAGADVGTIQGFSIAYVAAAETSVNTAGDGSYSFVNLASGTYAVRQVVPSGWSAVAPVGGYVVTMVAGTSVINRDFGSYQSSTPTVATTAAVSPNPPTTNVAATLSVLGADVNGEANLTYAWSVTAKPAGAVDPTFGATGTNAAKSTSVTFAAPGSYTLRATVTNAGGASVTSDVSVTVNAPVVAPQLTGFTVNGGAAQRSMVTSLTLTFDRPVTLGAGALALARAGGGSAVQLLTSPASGLATVHTVTFAGAGTTGGSLLDGLYKLTVTATAVTDATGQAMGGGNRAYDFHRYFGDADGDRDVDGTDSRAFRAALGSFSTGPAYRAWFDIEGDGDVDGTDSRAFRSRLGTSI